MVRQTAERGAGGAAGFIADRGPEESSSAIPLGSDPPLTRFTHPHTGWVGWQSCENEKHKRKLPTWTALWFCCCLPAYHSLQYHSNEHNFSAFNVLFGLTACLCVTPSVCKGDEEELEQQSAWHSELLSGLDKVDVCMEQLQQEQEKWTTQGGDWATALHALVRGNTFLFCHYPCGFVFNWHFGHESRKIKLLILHVPAFSLVSGLYTSTSGQSVALILQSGCDLCGIWAKFRPLNRTDTGIEENKQVAMENVHC